MKPLYQSGAHPESMADMGLAARIELASPEYRSGTLPTELRQHHQLGPGVVIETTNLRVTNAVLCRLS